MEKEEEQELKLIKWDMCKFEIVHFKQVSTGIKGFTHKEIVANILRFSIKHYQAYLQRNTYNMPYNYKELCQRRDPYIGSLYRKTTH